MTSLRKSVILDLDNDLCVVLSRRSQDDLHRSAVRYGYVTKLEMLRDGLLGELPKYPRVT